MMWRRYFFNGYLLSVTVGLLLFACTRTAKSHDVTRDDVLKEEAKSTHPIQPKFCGGRLAETAVHDYLENLESVLNRGAFSSIKDRRLFLDEIILTVDGKVLKLNRKDLDAYQGKLPSKEDWRTIAELLQEGQLQYVGWRGCILSNGKAGFDTNDEGGIGLDSFNFDQSWKQ